MTEPYSQTTPLATPPLQQQPPRRGLGGWLDDTNKPTYLTTEFIVFVVVTLGIILTALVVQRTEDHGDYFRADHAWWLITLLAIGYMVSRGLSKIGRRRD